jgi:hypothetical protein
LPELSAKANVRFVQLLGKAIQVYAEGNVDTSAEYMAAAQEALSHQVRTSRVSQHLPSAEQHALMLDALQRAYEMIRLNRPEFEDAIIEYFEPALHKLASDAGEEDVPPAPVHPLVVKLVEHLDVIRTYTGSRSIEARLAARKTINAYLKMAQRQATTGDTKRQPTTDLHAQAVEELMQGVGQIRPDLQRTLNRLIRSKTSG